MDTVANNFLNECLDALRTVQTPRFTMRGCGNAYSAEEAIFYIETFILSHGGSLVAVEI